MKKFVSILLSAMLLLTSPLLSGLASAFADDDAGQQTPSAGETIALEVEEMDPAKLHVHKLGEVTEDEEIPDDGFDPAELEIIDLNKIVRVSIFLDEKSTIDTGYEVQSSGAKAYRNKLRSQQATMQAKIEEKLGHLIIQ